MLNNFNKWFFTSAIFILIIGIVLFSYFFHPFDKRLLPDNNIKIIHYVDHISTAHQKVIDLFNRKHEGKIKVEAINLPFEKFSTNERKEILVRFLRSKNERIDVFSVDQIWVPRFARWAVPLNDFVNANEKNNILKYALESCSYNDSLVAVPLYIDFALMYYRDDLLKKLEDYNGIKEKLTNSLTWDDFISLHKRLNNSSSPFFLFQADDYEGFICMFTEMIAGQNGSLVKDGKITLNTPEAKNALKLIVDLVHKYKLSPNDVVTLREIPSFKKFIDENGYFLRGWPGMVKDYGTSVKYPEIYKNLRRAPTPHFEGYNPVSVFGGWNLMISKFSANKPEALEFVKYLLGEEAQKILFTDGGYLPINNKVLSDTSFVKRFDDLQFYLKTIKTGIHRPFLENYTGISDIISHYLNLAVRQKLSVNQALFEAQKEIDSKIFLIN